MRVDKKKNVAKIAKEVLKNPLQTQRQLAAKIGIGKTTVQENIKEIKATKDDRILGICDKDLEIVKLSQFISNFKLSEMKDKLESGDSELDMRDVKTASEIAKESTARYTLFKGDVTDENGGFKKPDVIFEIVNPLND